MSSQPSSESVFRPAFVLMSGRALGFVASFAIPLVLVRIFAQGEFGTYKQLFLIYATLYGVVQFGMAESLFYFLPAAEERGGHYALNAMLTLGLAGALCLAVLWAAAPAIGAGFNNASLPGYVPLLGIYLLLMLVSAPLEIVTTARKRHRYAFWAYALTDFLRACLCILPVLFFRDLSWLLYGAIACAALRLVATLVYLRREFGATLRPDWSLLWRQVAYAGPFALAVAIDVLQSNLHQYAVSYRFDAATFAIYSVGCLQVPLVDFMMTSTGNVLMVRMRESLQARDGVSALALWLDTTRKLALVFIPLAGMLLVTASDLIVSLFTRSYAGSVPVFMVWCAIIPLSALLTDAVLRVHAATRFLILVNLAKLALVLGLLAVLMPPFGVQGAVLAALLAALLSKGLALYRIKHLMRVGITGLLPWRSIVAIIVLAAAAAVPALLLKSMLDVAPPLRLLATGAAYALACLALMLRFGPLQTGEKQAVSGRLQRPLAQLRDAWDRRSARRARALELARSLDTRSR